MKHLSFHHVLGLELGERTVQAVHLYRRGPFIRLRNAERLRLPADPAAAFDLFRSFVEKNGWTHLPCVIGLRGADLMLRIVRIPAGEGRSLSDLVEHQMEQFRGLAVGDTVADYALLPGERGSRRALMAVARAERVEQALELPLKSGLEVVDVVPAPLAVFYTLQYVRGWRRTLYAGVHISESVTDVIVARRRNLLFLRRLEIGAHDLRGGDDETAEQAVERWARELHSCLKLYHDETRERRRRPRTVVLCGTGRLPDGIRSAAERATGLPVVGLSDFRRGRRMVESNRHAAAVGLALSGAGWPRGRLSLMPAALRESLALRWQFKYWLGAAVAVVLALVFVALGMAREARRRERHCGRIEHRLERLRREDDTLRELNEANEVLLSKLRPLRASVRNGRVVRAVLGALVAAKHPQDWITLLADSYSYFNRGIAGSDGERTDSPGLQRRLAPDTLYFEQLVVEGYTPEEDLSTVLAMIEALRSDPAIAQADLLGDDELRDDLERDARWEQTGARLFAVEIKLNHEGSDGAVVP